MCHYCYYHWIFLFLPNRKYKNTSIPGAGRIQICDSNHFFPEGFGFVIKILSYHLGFVIPIKKGVRITNRFSFASLSFFISCEEKHDFSEPSSSWQICDSKKLKYLNSESFFTGRSCDLRNFNRKSSSFSWKIRICDLNPFCSKNSDLWFESFFFKVCIQVCNSNPVLWICTQSFFFMNDVLTSPPGEFLFKIPSVQIKKFNQTYLTIFSLNFIHLKWMKRSSTRLDFHCVFSHTIGLLQIAMHKMTNKTKCCYYVS